MSKFFLRKNKKDDDPKIKVLSKPDELACGGTYSYIEIEASKQIDSNDMILFDVTSALGSGHMIFDSDGVAAERLGYISAFAAPAQGGTFMFISKGEGFHRSQPKINKWALVKENVFNELAKLVSEQNLAENNGRHSKTYGLPEDFGGSIDIKYASGEKISISNNQSPVLSLDAAIEIAEVFDNAMKGEAVALPDISSLKSIRFSEKRKDGGFTEATLVFLPDGTGSNSKRSKYDTPTVYESVKPVEAEVISAIKNNIVNNGVLAWAGLPESSYGFNSEKTLTFVFGSGDEITVIGNKIVPDQIKYGFFNIELEMTTKH